MTKLQTHTMTKSAKALLSGIIDYAGFFPPAKLDYNTALNNYCNYRESSFSWILSRFISPTKKFEELRSYINNNSIDTIKIVSILRPADSYVKYISQLSSEYELISSLPNKVDVDFIETTLPNNIEPLDYSGLVTAIKETFDNYNYNKLFIESRIINYEDIDVNNYVNGIGIKIRCGGPVLESVPSLESLAHTISYVASNNIPIKFTAGLHHPIRHFDPILSGMVHGFINVFVASLIAYDNINNHDMIINVLMDEDPSNFIFNDSSLSYRDISISLERIEEIRSMFLYSFGTCSFDDPIDDLTSLGII